MKFKRVFNISPFGFVEADIEVHDDIWNKWVKFTNDEEKRVGKTPEELRKMIEKEFAPITKILAPYEYLSKECTMVAAEINHAMIQPLIERLKKEQQFEKDKLREGTI